MKQLSASLALLLSFGVSCSKKEEAAEKVEPAPEASGEATADPKPEPETKVETPPEPEPEAAPAASEGLAMIDFPNSALQAEPGQYVFSPNDSSFKAAHEGPDAHRLGRFSWGIVKVESVGDVESELTGLGTKYKIPNAYIMPIAKDSAVAVGDLVAASKYGNNFEHAYVMEVGDKVKANFIHTMPYGDKSGELKPNQYFKIAGGLEVGSPVMVRTKGLESKSKLDGIDKKVQSFDGLELFKVLKVDGDNFLLTGHQGKIIVAPKTAIVEIPLKPELKKGDKVCAVWDTLHFRDGVLKSIDAKLGHYEVTFGTDDKPKKVPFGTLVAGSSADYY